MDKAKHSSSLAQDGPAVSPAQEPEGIRTLLCSICGSPRPHFLCQGFCLRGQSGPWFFVRFLSSVICGKEKSCRPGALGAVQQQESPQCWARGEQDICQDTSLGSTGGAHHSRAKPAGKGKAIFSQCLKKDGHFPSSAFSSGLWFASVPPQSFPQLRNLEATVLIAQPCVSSPL